MKKIGLRPWRVWLVAAVVALAGAHAQAVTPRQAEVDKLYATYRAELDVPEVAAAAVLAADSPLLVDVRREAERAVSVLPGAIDQQTFEAMPRTERQGAIIYCTIGVRSGQYVAALAEQGIAASNLAGGLLSWVHAGGALVRDGQRVQEAHVYGRRWDLLPEPYKTQWFWWVL